jgi:pyruvate-formate lyase
MTIHLASNRRNIPDYWRSLESLKKGDPDLPSERVCTLMLKVFNQWETKPLWLTEEQTGTIFDGLMGDDLKSLENEPVKIRKAKSIRKLFERITTNGVAEKAGTFSIHPQELIVGTMPPFSVGQGKELVSYLTEEEKLFHAINFFDDRSNFGHVVPHHAAVLEKGLSGLIEECEQAKRADKNNEFFEACIIALNAVIFLAERYEHLARAQADAAQVAAALLEARDERRNTLLSNKVNLLQIADRLSRTPRHPPGTLLEACQCLFMVHCALHTSGETTSVGRLDQILYPFYDADVKANRITKAEAQEIIDCLWLKFDERVILNARHAEDRFTFADGALLGNPGPSNFDQGSLRNQWMQQVTIGGLLPTNEQDAIDATNDLTYMCLQASRRMPLNSPTVDLRLHKNSPQDIIKLAAQTMLSGGAHPVLLNDDRIIPRLKTSGNGVELRSARNYACDGCYETLFAGETEFSFGYVPAIDILEKTLNRGATFGASGSVHLRGFKSSWRTIDAKFIKSFDEEGDGNSLWSIFRKHLELSCHRFLSGILTFYGAKESVAPSPLLSCLIAGCLESGRDFYGGGARYHIFAPLMTGISTCADSLYVVKKLVFEERLFTLEELVSCLRSDWGKRPIAIGRHLTRERIGAIRQACMYEADGSDRPKFGHGIREVDELAWRLIREFSTTIEKVKIHVQHKSKWEQLRDRFGANFEILLTPGVGTFEQYVYSGGFAGATPDGRPAGSPIASDLSASPIHADLPATLLVNGRLQHQRQVDIFRALDSFANESVDLLSDGAPPDFNIREDFPEEKLVAVIKQFAEGRAGNVLTITVANPETLAAAQMYPEGNRLIRNRMGGWTEFFVVLSQEHQNQHMRRPLYIVRGVNDARS